MSLRNEGIALRPFSGVDHLEGVLAENFRVVVTASGKKEEILAGDSYFFDKEELLRCGLDIELTNVDAIKSAAAPLCQSDDDADWVVIAQDGVRSAIRGSQVLASGPISDIPASIQLAKPVERNEGTVMGHPHAARTVSLSLVYNKSIPTQVSTKPRIKGAILASASVSLAVQPSNEALKPKHLTESLKSEWKLSAQTWFHFKAQSDLLECESLEEAFKFYVDKEILDAYPGASKEYRQLFELQLFSLVITQVVTSVHKALSALGGELEMVANSAVVRLFNSIFSNSRTLMKEWPTRLLDDPDRLLSEALAAGGSSKTILRILQLEDPNEQEVNND